MEKEEHNSQQINKEHLYVTFLLSYISLNIGNSMLCAPNFVAKTIFYHQLGITYR